MFTPIVRERLGWYVYALRNPLDGRVFYIGKGIGNRVFMHAKDAKDIFAGEVDRDGSVDKRSMSPKLELIDEIHCAGREVETIILRHGLATERLAYEVEAAIVDAFELLDPSLDNQHFVMTNLVKGHHHALKGKATAAAAASLFEAEPLVEPGVPIVFFNIPKLWTPSMSDAEVYEATRGWWILGERVLRARYAAGVNKNVIRGVYEIAYWRERVEGDRDWDPLERPRKGFVGRPAVELKQMLGKSIKHLPVGGSVRYLNCDESDPALNELHRGSAAEALAKSEGA